MLEKHKRIYVSTVLACVAFIWGLLLVGFAKYINDMSLIWPDLPVDYVPVLLSISVITFLTFLVLTIYRRVPRSLGFFILISNVIFILLSLLIIIF